MGVGCSRVLRCLAKSPAEAGSDPPKNTRVTFPNLLPCNEGVENSFFPPEMRLTASCCLPVCGLPPRVSSQPAGPLHANLAEGSQIIRSMQKR